MNVATKLNRKAILINIENQNMRVLNFHVIKPQNQNYLVLMHCMNRDQDKFNITLGYGQCRNYLVLVVRLYDNQDIFYQHK